MFDVMNRRKYHPEVGQVHDGVMHARPFQGE